MKVYNIGVVKTSVPFHIKIQFASNILSNEMERLRFSAGKSFPLLLNMPTAASVDVDRAIATFSSHFYSLRENAIALPHRF